MSIIYCQSAFNTFYELHIQTGQRSDVENGLNEIMECTIAVLSSFLTDHMNCLKFHLVCEAQMQVISLKYKSFYF